MIYTTTRFLQDEINGKRHKCDRTKKSRNDQNKWSLCILSPVCKKCRNYVMDFPCPHCGSEQALTDREEDEIKPIIPLDLQESFGEPPPPSHESGQSYTPPYQPPESPTKAPPVSPPPPRPSYAPQSTPTPKPLQTKPAPPQRPPPTPPLPRVDQKITHAPPPTPSPPRVEQEIKRAPLSAPVARPELVIEQVPPPIPPKLSIKGLAHNSGTMVPLEEIKEQFKQVESHFKDINSHQKKSDSDIKQLESSINEINKKLDKIEKSFKVLYNANKKLESLHKDTAKDLKKFKP